jgi:tryptophan synthase alpha subunit
LLSCLDNLNLVGQIERFATETREAGLTGAIVPDCPPEEGTEYVASMRKHGLAPIFIFSPRTSDALRNLGSLIAAMRLFAWSGTCFAAPNVRLRG